jgi:putative copper resistance protein D
MDLSWTVAGVRYVQLTAIVGLFGSALFRLYAPRGATAPAPRYALALALVALIATVLAASLSLADAMEDMMAIASRQTWAAFLFETSFGWVWLFSGMALVGVVAALMLLPADADSQPLAVALLAGALLVVQAWLGHPASGHGGHRLAAILAFDVHMLAAGAWLGGLPSLCILLRSRRSGLESSDSILGTTLRRFSLLGVGAVVLVVLSGFGNIALTVSSPADLLAAPLATPYGRILTLKLGLFLLMLVCAAANRFLYTPAILKGDAGGVARAGLTRSVLIEQALALAVLAAAVLLAATAPPH